MGLETGTFIDQLDPNNPTPNDPKSQGDDHLRLIKTVLQGQFTSLGEVAVTATAEDLNKVPNVVDSVQILQRGAVVDGDFFTAANVAIASSDAIPQKTQGVQVMTLPFTPLDATSLLRIDMQVSLSIALGQDYVKMCLFDELSNNAIHVQQFYTTAANNLFTISSSYLMPSGVDTEKTFTVRVGGATTAAIYFNGVASGRLYGGRLNSSIMITEYK